jgi:hypothetical protein
MADLYNSDLGQNALKAQPSSLFGTRNLKFLHISVNYNLFTDDGIGYDGYLESDSMYSRIIRVIQEVAELYVIGAPSALPDSTHNFVIAIASDTAQWQYSEEGNYDYNEIGIDETEASQEGHGAITQHGWPTRYVYKANNQKDSAVATVCDALFYFFRDNTPINNEFSVRVLEDTGFGLLPGTYLF